MCCLAWDTGSQTDEYVYQPFFLRQSRRTGTFAKKQGANYFFICRLFLTRHRLSCAQAAALPEHSSLSDKCTKYRSRSNMLTYGSLSFAATFASRVGLILSSRVAKKNTSVAAIGHTNEPRLYTGLTDDHPTLTTYFEGEIISGHKHTFTTRHADWGATLSTDLSHWAKFPAFRPYAKQARRSSGSSQVIMKDVAQSEHVFMRWKEHFLVPDHRVRTITGASFEGFYYICFNQVQGTVSGIYFHSKSERSVNSVVSSSRVTLAGCLHPCSYSSHLMCLLRRIKPGYASANRHYVT